MSESISQIDEREVSRQAKYMTIRKKDVLKERKEYFDGSLNVKNYHVLEESEDD